MRYRIKQKAFINNTLLKPGTIAEIPGPARDDNAVHELLDRPVVTKPVKPPEGSVNPPEGSVKPPEAPLQPPSTPKVEGTPIVAPGSLEEFMS